MNAGAIGLVCAAALAGAGVMTGGCASTRIALNEQLGYTKREQLVDRVKEARDGQIAAKTQFATALEEFKAVTGTSGSAELEAQYDTINRSYERSKSRADDVNSRIESVQRVAGLLFDEWAGEIKQMSSDSARRASRDQLDATKTEYERLLGSMQGAAAKMSPVLAALNDRRLLLKHSLNASAIASLKGNLADLETDVGALIREMEAAIAEANGFIERSTAAN